MLLSCIGIIQAQEMEMMFVGTYTDGGSKGVYSYRFYQETGEAVVLDSLEMANRNAHAHRLPAHPRMFNITPNGRFLLCCCRDSNKIQVFRRDADTGLLTDTHQDIPLSKPVCVQFF